MNEMQRLAERRHKLLAQSAQLRKDLGVVAGQFQRPLALVDKGYAVARGIKSHPGIAVAGVSLVALVILKRGGLGKLASVLSTSVRFALPIFRFWLARRPPKS